MEKSLYRKYRSKDFSQVIGQEPITKTLANALKKGLLSHAYLFSGPKGVGKTSVARILAHKVNKLPYNEELTRLDIIEIDAASNRRIDEIRDLRDKVNIVPTSAKYKVYIVDEVHMLTREAFNALLKTLEEPPAHCIFILATTEVHKLPETIISRTQHFNFKPIASQKIAKHLAKIAKSEGIKAEPEALTLLAEFGNGSFRDSISMLDQLSSYGELISQKSVRELLGLPTSEAVESLYEAIAKGNAKQTLEILTELAQSGINPSAVATQLSAHLRQLILNPGAAPKQWMSGLLKNLLEVSAATLPQDCLEIYALEAAMQNQSDLRSPSALGSKSQQIDIKQDIKPLIEPKGEPSKIKPASAFSLNLWPKVLDAIKAEANSLYTVLRLAEPELEGSELTLNFQFSLHQKKINEAHQRSLIQKVIEQLSNDRIIIHTQLKPSAKVKKSAPAPAYQAPASTELETISNIFGQSEVLES